MTGKPNLEKDPNEELVSADDAVIGRAFRYSLWFFLAAGLLAAAFLIGRLWRQAPDEVLQTAPAAAPVVRSEALSVAVPVVRFSDITRASGIDFVHINGARGDKLLPETMGGGAAFLDYDGDGDQDLLLVNGSYWPDDPRARESMPTMALYRNDGAGRFADATAESGLNVGFYGMGVAVGDYDADGWIDVFITALGPNRLFRNRGGRFEEVTAEAGVAGAAGEWSTSSAFFDYDNDGDLDLFVCNYVRWSKDIDLELNFQLTGIGRAYGPPTSFQGTQPYLYRNDGDGRFSDVSAQAGVQVSNPATGLPMAKALAVAPVDADGDGWLDLIVANDTVQNFFYRNRGDGSFEEVGAAWGVAFDRNGAATGAMGIDAARYRNDAALGIAIGNFANEMSSLYVAQGAGLPFSDEGIIEGIGPASRRALTFGLFFFDYDLDGRLDLFQANGHLENEINRVQASQHYRQPPQLFWNCGDKCGAAFVEVAPETAADLAKPLVGRGAAYADIDGDGDLDLLVTQPGEAPVLLRNDQALGQHWLRVRLIGRDGNRDAIGAWVTLKAGDLIQRRQLMPTRSYLSQVELPLTFGLGDTTVVDNLKVFWPDGSVQALENVAVDMLLVIEQPGSN